jgi:hypothetical protein
VLWFAWDQASPTTHSLIALSGIVLAAIGAFAGATYIRRQRSIAGSPAGLDTYFDLAYRRELGLQERTDLRALWETVRGTTLQSFRVLGPRGLPKPWVLRKPLRQLDQVIESEIPKLRRAITGFRGSPSR